MESEELKKHLVARFLIQRRLIGVAGFLLPVVMLSSSVITRTPIQTSLSAYYHTDMRNIFVATLCAIGAFLLAYRGYDRSGTDKSSERTDNEVGNAAGVFAIGVALCPTSGATTVGITHWISAALLFSSFAYFSLVLFPRTGPGGAVDPSAKTRRNKVYKWCGRIILGCLAMLGAYAVVRWLDVEVGFMDPVKPVFWLESIAVLSFGFSWMTKGQAMWMKAFNDRATAENLGM